VYGFVKAQGSLTPIANVDVLVKEGGAAACCTVVTSGATDANGYFAITVALTGSYKLYFLPPAGYLGEFWQDQSDFTLATNVALSGSPVSIGTAQLTAAPVVSGTVNGPSGALAGVLVIASAPSESGCGFGTAAAMSDALGHYDLTLPANTYRIEYLPTTPGIAPKWSGGGATYATAANVSVAGNMTLATVTLAAGYAIVGTVSDANGSIANAFVAAYATGTSSSCGNIVASSSTDGAGAYSVTVPAGTYKLHFGDVFHIFEFWNDEVDYSSATPLTVSANVTGISAMLETFGQVWTWGYDLNGQLGDFGSTNRTMPYHVIEPGFSQVSGGSDFSLARRVDGTVWAWGANGQGQLGVNYPLTERAPVQVVGLTDIQAISASQTGHHSLAVHYDGTVSGWGRNGNGQIGDGTTTQRSLAVAVSGLTGVAAVAAGSTHSLALKSDGTVWAWGGNAFGQLGDGTMIDRLTPVQVTGLTNIEAIAAGAFFSLALKNDGTVWAWGRNDVGQFGDGTTTDRSLAAATGLTGVNAISAGPTWALALKSDGSISSWGSNAYGQLGDGTTTPRLSPVTVSGIPLSNGAIAVAAGGGANYALLADGSVRAWGRNAYGDLGDGTTTESHVPVVVSGLTDVTAISGGGIHGMALRTPIAIRVTGSVAVGTMPVGIGTNISTGRVYVANKGSNSVSVIDATTGFVIGTIAVGANPEGVGVLYNSADKIYVANNSDNTVSVIDGATNAIVATVAVGTSPVGVAVDQNYLVAYVTNGGSASVSRIDGTTNTVTATITVGTNPGFPAVNHVTHYLYVPNTGDNTVSVIDELAPLGPSVIATVPVGTAPIAATADETNDRVYVTNSGDNTVSVIDGASQTVIATISVGASPRGIAHDLTTDRIYVANFGANTVSVIHGSTMTVIATISTPSAFGVAVNWPTLYRVFVGNNGAGTVTFLD
jgi:YVTN family beta-propeller protein